MQHLRRQHFADGSDLVLHGMLAPVPPRLHRQVGDVCRRDVIGTCAPPRLSRDSEPTRSVDARRSLVLPELQHHLYTGQDPEKVHLLLWPIHRPSAPASRDPAFVRQDVRETASGRLPPRLFPLLSPRTVPALSGRPERAVSLRQADARSSLFGRPRRQARYAGPLGRERTLAVLRRDARPAARLRSASLRARLPRRRLWRLRNRPPEAVFLRS